MALVRTVSADFREYLWTIRSGWELQDPRPLPPTRNYSKSLLVRLLEINNVCFFLLHLFPYPSFLPPLLDVSCGWALRALRCWMFNITRAIIYAWRAGQRPHNLDQWAELACSTTLRLVPYGVYLVTLYLNASRNTLYSLMRSLILFERSLSYFNATRAFVGTIAVQPRRIERFSSRFPKFYPLGNILLRFQHEIRRNNKMTDRF